MSRKSDRIFQLRKPQEFKSAFLIIINKAGIYSLAIVQPYASKKIIEIYYHRNTQKMKEIDAWLEPFRQLWEGRFGQLDTLLDKLKNNNDDQHT